MSKRWKDRTQTSTFILILSAFPGGGVIPDDKFVTVFLFTYPVPGVVLVYPPVVREFPGEFHEDQTIGTLVDFTQFL